MVRLNNQRLLRKENKLFIPVIILSLSVIILGVTSQILIDSFLKDIKANANYTGLIRKQRALSQQIIKDVVAKDWARLSNNESIDSLLIIATKQNKILYTGDKAINLKPPAKDLLSAYRQMDNAFKDFAATIPKIDTNKNAASSFLNLMNKQQIYSREIDNYSAAITKYTNDKINEFYLKAVLLMAARVLIVSLEVFFIFLPAVKKIQKQNKQLKAIAYHQSHIVRSPLCSIIGTLSLVQDAEKSKVKELVTMATMEAERLDNIIKETVSLTHQY
jgi:hypothetical protein